MRIHVGLTERVFVLVDGTPSLFLRPGVHTLFRPFQRVDLVRVDTTKLVADLDAPLLALVPDEELTLVSLGRNERGLVRRRGRPVAWLGEGLHALWVAERIAARGARGESAPAITVERFDTSALAAPVLAEAVRALIPASDLAEVTVPDGFVAIRWVEGAIEAELGVGRHAAWSTARKVAFTAIDLRERLVQVTGQEVLTRDRVSLRLNLAATHRVADARRLATVARSADELVHLAMQLAAREQVALRTLDELLADREAVSEAMVETVRRKAELLGLTLTSFGIKDVVLPGEMKTLLNRVIEAQKQAEANVILRREETAATRSMAQTARVLAESPLLMRLKELEALGQLAGKVEKLQVVVGAKELPAINLGS